MVQELNVRIKNDAQAAGQRVADRASELQDRTGEAIEKVPGAQTLGEQIPKHPLTSIAAGLSAGMALGMLSGGGSDGHTAQREGSRGSDRQRADRSNGSSSGGLIDGIASAAVTSIAYPIQREIESVALEALNGFMGKTSSKQDQQSSRQTAGQIPPQNEGTTLS